ncbi:urease accessory protein [Scopulibacillus darangshiensis]|uniref:Urease accessory protein UreD n=1 Tax=Scopulibacillus darangshiensis TaxID=442528 RepID=A0A4R2PAC2_9BACL|nr:urease accessory protein UreD [Scopulibacillus darangshiensis]TCP30845.1 urease accessory protein [Scopulibacillus darangshiensis]
MVNWTGILNLNVEKKEDKTITKDVYFQGAFKIMRPAYLDKTGQACFYIINPGGGYLDGDRYSMSFTLDEHAELLLTTQSATKIYKTPNQPVVQETEILLKAGSVLEYMPDPLIAYHRARYKQKNVVRMEKGSTLIYTDIMTPGWSPDGEWFSYDSVQLKNEIYMEDKLVVFDHMKLEPECQNMQGIGQMEGFTHLGSMIVVSEKAASDFLDMLYETIDMTSQTYKIGVSSLSIPGFTLRVLATSTQQIEEIFMACHRLIRANWFDKQPIFLRKY